MMRTVHFRGLIFKLCFYMLSEILFICPKLELFEQENKVDLTLTQHIK